MNVRTYIHTHDPSSNTRTWYFTHTSVSAWRRGLAVCCVLCVASVHASRVLWQALVPQKIYIYIL